MTGIRVVIVDDEPLARRGVRQLLAARIAHITHLSGLHGDLRRRERSHRLDDQAIALDASIPSPAPPFPSATSSSESRRASSTASRERSRSRARASAW